MKDKHVKIFSYLRIVLLVLAIIIISFLIHINGITSIENVKEMIINAKAVGPLVYITMFSILPTFFVTVTVLAMAAGYVFGFTMASIYTFIGAFINSTITYYVGKYIAYDYLENILREKYSAIYDKLKKKSSRREGFIFMMMLRLLPFIPYTFLNYLSGVVGYDYLIFILSSMIGILPGLFVYVNIGDSLNGVGSFRFYIAIFIFVALAVLTTVIGRLMYSKEFFDKDKVT